MLDDNTKIRAENTKIRADNTKVLDENTNIRAEITNIRDKIANMEEKERKKRKLCVSTNFFSATYNLFLPLLARKRAEDFSHICGLCWDILILPCSQLLGKTGVV